MKCPTCGSSETNSGGGCLSAILGIILIWALCFGVTINGKHYGLSGCSADNGVEIDH